MAELHFSGQNATADFKQNDIDVSGVFTLEFKVKSNSVLYTNLIIKTSSGKKFFDHDFIITNYEANHIFLTRDENDIFKLYNNGKLLHTAGAKNVGSTPYIEFNGDNANVFSESNFYDFIAHKVVWSMNEIINTTNTQQPNEINFFVNGISFNDFGVVVESGKGLFDGIKLKDRTTQNYTEYHGDIIDTTWSKKQKREITLNCIIKAEDRISFLKKTNDFIYAFQSPQLKMLTVELEAGYPLAFMVYQSDKTAVTPYFNDEESYGTFSLKLIEPEPVKTIILCYSIHPFPSDEYIYFQAFCLPKSNNPEYINIYHENGIRHKDVPIYKDVMYEYKKTLIAPQTYKDLIVITGNIENLNISTNDYGFQKRIIWTIL